MIGQNRPGTSLRYNYLSSVKERVQEETTITISIATGFVFWEGQQSRFDWQKHRFKHYNAARKQFQRNIGI
jgi:hypothetical protein